MLSLHKAILRQKQEEPRRGGDRDRRWRGVGSLPTTLGETGEGLPAENVVGVQEPPCPPFRMLPARPACICFHLTQTKTLLPSGEHQSWRPGLSALSQLLSLETRPRFQGLVLRVWRGRQTLDSHNGGDSSGRRMCPHPSLTLILGRAQRRGTRPASGVGPWTQLSRCDCNLRPGHLLPTWLFLITLPESE